MAGDAARGAAAVRAVAFSPSGRHLALGLRNGELLVYAVPLAATGRPVQVETARN